MVSKTKTITAPVFWTFLTPVLVCFILVVVIPFFLGVFFSFTDWSSSAKNQGGLHFVGFINFTKSFEDPLFIYSFGITSAYTILNMAVINAVAFSLALLVSSQIKLKNVYRAGFFVPTLIGGLVLGFVWQFIFNNAVPFVAPFIGLGFLADPAHYILSNSITAILAMVIVATWQSAGYFMMIYLAAIQSVPQEYHEAAEIDGAGAWRRLRAITIPMVAQAFTVSLFLTLVSSFKVFDVNVSLTAGGPSTLFMDKAIPGTQMLAMNIYNTAFNANNLAMGQARAVIFFLALVIISLIQVSINKKKEVEL